ncbi:MAG TPA: HAD family phosphatase [Mycobacteriales bacterium]|nr:HAD family phosphatase [Mycobacteriales bacterium]
MGPWVVFDYGGVLCRDQSEEDRRALVELAGPGDPGRFWAAYWELRPAYDQGVLPAADYWTRVVGRGLSAGEVERIEGADVAGWSRPYGETLEIAARLAKDGTRLALLSNCPEPMAVAIDAMDWTDLIPRRFYSCRLGAIKPDPAVYTAVLTELGAAPADVTFVDDRPVNVAGAEAVGMRALLFTDPATLAGDLDLGDSWTTT